MLTSTDTPLPELKLRTGNDRIDALLPRIRWFLEHDTVEYDMFGSQVRGYRSPDAPSLWLRDHSDMMRGAKFWDRDLTSAIDHFAEMQSQRGWFFDYFTMSPEKRPCERENWAKYVRVPVEADVEYRFVKAVYLAWQASGNDRWLRGLMPVMEKALAYVMTDAWRWDRTRKLVKRPYTIDTWDFDYTAGRYPWLHFQVNDNTYWGIMHGDNSGYYEAFRFMAHFYRHLRNSRRARHWDATADGLRRRANATCFNGRFYTHRIPITPVTIPGVEEAEQLSLSNPMNINRGLPTHRMAVSILQEYQRRASSTGAFAEWFSIDPAFPAGIFGDEKLIPGAYCNGGIMPLVGGELARAALEHGYEEYGIQQLLKYEQLTRGNESYLWYFPNGTHATEETSTSPEAVPTDGWGSSAMLFALAEGLAGVVDLHKLFEHVRLSPRWIAAGIDEADITLPYGPSGAAFSYQFAHDAARKRVEITLGQKGTLELHLLLPPGSRATELKVNGRKVRHTNGKVEKSSYVDAEIPVTRKNTTLVLSYR